MARTQTIDFRSFIKNEKKSDLTAYKIVSLGGSMFAVLVPKTVLAATVMVASSSTPDATFRSIWPTILNIVDWICVGVFVFAGVAWMFGHRTKALELIIGGAAGYVLARHAIDIKDWLKGI